MTYMHWHLFKWLLPIILSIYNMLSTSTITFHTLSAMSIIAPLFNNSIIVAAELWRAAHISAVQPSWWVGKCQTIRWEWSGVCSYTHSLDYYLLMTYYAQTLLHTLSITSMWAPLSNKGLTVTAELRREAHISAVHPSCLIVYVTR